MKDKKIIFSGIKPTGEFQLGNYLGAIRNWKDLQDDNLCLYSIVDLHSITVRQDPEELRRRSLLGYATLIACGLDPDKNIMFFQSHVPEHSELSWILGCYTMFGELSRMTQFKDKSQKNPDNINGGLFTYPVLMAADILLYQADVVPVGEDQKQHVELTRNIAVRFNGIYGDTFTIPEPVIPKIGARIMSLTDPTSKMGKTDDNENSCIMLMDNPDTIMKKFKRAVTDSDSAVRYDPATKPGVSNLITIYALATGKTPEDVEKEFEGKGYGAFKPAVGEAVVELLRPIREKTEDLLKNPDYLENIYKDGAKKASELARSTMKVVWERLGFVSRA